MLFPAEIGRDGALPSVSDLLLLNKCPFHSPFRDMVFEFLCFLLVILWFKMVLKHSTDMLSSVPKCKTAVICLMRKIHVCDKLCLGMSYSSAGCEFSVNVPTIHH